MSAMRSQTARAKFVLCSGFTRPCADIERDSRISEIALVSDVYLLQQQRASDLDIEVVTPPSKRRKARQNQ